MEVVFSNPLIYIIDYPSHDAIELYDRRLDRVGLMVGNVAHKFRHDFDELLASHPEIEAFEDFIDHYSAVLSQTAVRH